MDTRQRQVLHGDQSILSSIPSWTARFGLFLVCCKVERDEEKEVGAEDYDASNGSEFFTSTFTGIWHPWEVSASEVGVRGEVDKAEIDNELGNL